MKRGRGEGGEDRRRERREGVGRENGRNSEGGPVAPGGVAETQSKELIQD